MAWPSVSPLGFNIAMTLCGAGSEYHRVGKGVAMFFQFRRPSKHEQAAGKCPTILTFQTKLMSVIGSNTPLESIPPWLATMMQASPSTHFVSFAQSILYRGAGIEVVWSQFLIVGTIGGLFFAFAVLRFRKTATYGM
jgi:hypothetical protein